MTTPTLARSSHQVRAPSGLTRFLNAPFSAVTWRSYGYLGLVLLLAPFAVAYTIFTLAFTAGTAVTVGGLFAAGALVVGGRGWGSLYRRLAGTLLDTHVAAPLPRRAGQGFWRTLGNLIGDLAGWRALLFMVASLPVALVGTVVSTALLVLGVASPTYWAWYLMLPADLAMDDSWHNPLGLGALALGGIVALLAFPWAVRAVVALLQLLTRTLLGPTASSLRVTELERSRAGTVEDADARLRRIERDLHDGTQARLVAVGMQLGEAHEQLATGDPDLAAELLEDARGATKDALAELRELARGIHPPALDSGLAVALATLAARAPLPVTVEVDPDVEAAGRLAPAIESIIYFSIAELVTNAAKHARAAGVDVLIDAGPGGETRGGARGDTRTVRIRVQDDGDGGASVVPPDGSGLRSGLAGLTERVRSVDGTFGLSSPLGGPTVVTMTLPATRAVPRSVPDQGERA